MIRHKPYSHVTEDPLMLSYSSINLSLGDWRADVIGAPGQKSISDVAHGTFITLACSRRPIPLPAETHTHKTYQQNMQRRAHLATSRLLLLIRFPCNHKRTVSANWQSTCPANSCSKWFPNVLPVLSPHIYTSALPRPHGGVLNQLSAGTALPFPWSTYVQPHWFIHIWH
jgi:hypothetical protein